jgi:uncharacterized protein with PIN domain
MSVHQSTKHLISPLLLCDEMLARLCRWLRAAGHDCAMLPAGSRDREIMHLARKESRLILTRDRQFMEYPSNEGSVLLLKEQALEDQARTLSHILGIDWMYRPFTRCLVCNTPLISADRMQRQALKIHLRDDEPLWLCPGCQRNYWAGGHVHRMYHRLQKWTDKFH